MEHDRVSERIFSCLDIEARSRGITLLSCARLVESLARLDGLSPMDRFAFGASDEQVAKACRELVLSLSR